MARRFLGFQLLWFPSTMMQMYLLIPNHFQSTMTTFMVLPFKGFRGIAVIELAVALAPVT
jgi:hypothetical protein